MVWDGSFLTERPSGLFFLYYCKKDSQCMEFITCGMRIKSVITFEMFILGLSQLLQSETFVRQNIAILKLFTITSIAQQK